MVCALECVHFSTFACQVYVLMDDLQVSDQFSFNDVSFFLGIVAWKLCVSERKTRFTVRMTGAYM